MNLEQARQSSTLTQKQLAILIDSTQANISLWERGLAKPQARTRRKLAQVLGPIDWGAAPASPEEFELQELAHSICKFVLRRPDKIQNLYNLLNQWADYIEDTHHVR